MKLKSNEVEQLLNNEKGKYMTNWEHFKRFYKAWKPWFKFPKCRLVKADDFNELKDNPHAVAFYKVEDNSINILSQHKKNRAVFLHECGHWINIVIYGSLEIIWEFIWWGCSIRSIFVKTKYLNNKG